MHSTNGSKNTYFVQGDGWILHRTDRSNLPLTFDLLFKIYYVLNLEYSACLKNFYNMIQTLIYKIPGDTLPSVASTYALIQNIDPKEINEDSEEDLSSSIVEISLNKGN